jgi:hypothetical protein
MCVHVCVVCVYAWVHVCTCASVCVHCVVCAHVYDVCVCVVCVVCVRAHEHMVSFLFIEFQCRGKTSAIWCVLYVTLRIISYLKVRTQG